ncbi:MAG TPA: ATP-dependent DNA helicase, partial [Gammaproteobacteria bacterium]|nr:ATP-dependent DNA helicase [Gammaproteobacteria bacterium]
VHAEALEHAAKALLRRYGVMCRKLLPREQLAPSWRELLPIYRAAEARGDIRGGRFVEPLGGEQFALIEAVEELRRLRRHKETDEWVALAAADPLNLANVLDEGQRPVAAGNRRLVFRNGEAVAAQTPAGVAWLAQLDPTAQRQAAALLAPEERGDPRPRQRGWWRR